jgi:hypothetical protein
VIALSRESTLILIVFVTNPLFVLTLTFRVIVTTFGVPKV